MTNRVQLEKEAKERYELTDLAYQSDERWKIDKAAWDEEKNDDLLDSLEHAVGQVQQLQGKVETLDCKLVELCVEVHQTQEAKNKRWKETRWCPSLLRLGRAMSLK